MAPLKLTSQRKQRRRRRRSPSRTATMTFSHLAPLAMQMIRSRRISSSKEVTRTTSSPLMMPRTATHRLRGKRRKRRRRALSCHLSVWALTTRPSTLRRYPSLMMMVASPANALAGASRKARPPHAWRRTLSSRQPFTLSSQRARRRRPSDPSLRNRRQMTTISTLMMRTRKQRSSRAAVA
jgi:hypothetical protein